MKQWLVKRVGQVQVEINAGIAFLVEIPVELLVVDSLEFLSEGSVDFLVESEAKRVEVVELQVRS